MVNPLVTVIVPAYNHEKYIEDCLRSVVEQTYDNLEIIVFNDGSTDSTDLVIKNFINLSVREITYISKTNEGLCKTLNRGLKTSKGKYITLIASDDLWLPSKIEEQVRFLEANSNIGLLFSDAYFLVNEVKTLKKYSDYKTRLKKLFKNSIQNANIYESLLSDNVILALTVMVRNECFTTVGFFDESLKYEDYDMWLRISKHYPIAYIDQVLAYYRVHDTNVSNNASLMLVGALQSILKQFKEKPLKNQPIKLFIISFKFIFTALKNRIFKNISIRR